MNYLTVSKGDNTVTYGNKVYRVQNDRNHLHIIVRVNGDRKKLTIKHKPERPYNVFCDYYLNGLSETHKCIVQDWWMEMITVNGYVNFKIFYECSKGNKNKE